jgi:hypothetical protein
VPRPLLLAAALAAVALGGCSLKDESADSGGSSPVVAPPTGVKSSDKKATEQLGFPITATRNTTRVTGSDPVADAAGVASALFPAASEATRPPAVLLVDRDDWQAAIAAGALAAAPVRAPILLTDGDSLPPVTSKTLARLDPKGTGLTSKAQAILVGSKPPPPEGLKSAVIRGKDPYELAVAIDKFASVTNGKPSGDVIIASGEKPEFAMPAAAWAGRSGDAVLFTKKDSLPDATRKALEEHQKPSIFVLGPTSVISAEVEKQLKGLGKVKRIGGPTAVETAVAFASFKSGAFGWGPIAPGGSYTVANTARPADAAAAAGLGGNGVFAPLLLTDKSDELPKPLEGFFLDIQPGYYQGEDPRQVVFNHVWILGGTDAVSSQVQDRIDQAAALVTVDEPSR